MYASNKHFTCFARFRVLQTRALACRTRTADKRVRQMLTRHLNQHRSVGRRTVGALRRDWHEISNVVRTIDLTLTQRFRAESSNGLIFSREIGKWMDVFFRPYYDECVHIRVCESRSMPAVVVGGGQIIKFNLIKIEIKTGNNYK